MATNYGPNYQVPCLCFTRTEKARAMTEPGWERCSDPLVLLFYLGQTLSERQLMLLSCHWLRTLGPFQQDPTAWRAVTSAERFADGLLSRGELESIFTRAWKTGWESLRAAAAAILGSRHVIYHRAIELLRSVAGKWMECAYGATKIGAPSGVLPPALWRRHLNRFLNGQADLVREIRGNPYRSVAVEPAWLRWQNGTVGRLAGAIYEDDRFEELPVLADALEEAGCTDPEILEHCRARGRHARGCWLVDRLLGRERPGAPVQP